MRKWVAERGTDSPDIWRDEDVAMATTRHLLPDEGTARTGRADRFTAGDEQARADSAADGDHVHVAGFQAAAQSLLLLSFFHAKSQPFFH